MEKLSFNCNFNGLFRGKLTKIIWSVNEAEITNLTLSNPSGLSSISADELDHVVKSYEEKLALLETELEKIRKEQLYISSEEKQKRREFSQPRSALPCSKDSIRFLGGKFQRRRLSLRFRLSSWCSCSSAALRPGWRAVRWKNNGKAKKDAVVYASFFD